MLPILRAALSFSVEFMYKEGRWAKDKHRHFTKEEVQPANELTKGW